MNDGILHTILVKKVSRLTFLRLFGTYSAGEHERLHRLARVVTAKVTRIRSEAEEIVTCLDGETFRSHDVTMKLADKKLNFFGPKGCDCNKTAKQRN